MWKKVCSFELRYQLRQPLFGASAVVFFLLGVALASSDVGNAVGNSPGTTLRDAPVVIVRLMPVVSLLGLFVVTAFVASSALRDFERRSDMLFFTKPLGKIDYLGGRFAGSMAVSCLVLLTAVMGLIAGYFMPWQPAGRLGPFSITSYVFGLLVIVIPNLLVMGALFFALAIWSRRLTLTYLCVVFFIGMQDLVEVVAQNIESRVLGSLIEPSGIVALETVVRYWTIAEQNTRLPELGGVLLANRLVWLGLAFAVLAASLSRFDFSPREQRTKKTKRFWWKAARPEIDTSPPGWDPRKIALPRANQSFTRAGHWRQLLRQSRLEISEVFSSAAFLTLLAIGLMFIVAYSFVAGSDNGVPSYPLTHLMLQSIALGVRLTLVMILVLYAGELVFNQRALKLSEVHDALPVPNWVLMGAKLAVLVSIIGAFLLVATFSTVAVQLSKGFLQLDPGLYARGLVILALPLLPLVILAICLQVLSNRKILGFLLMAIALILKFALPRVGLENNLYLYGAHPPISYTALSGYGHHLEPFLWFTAYWSFGAVILWVVALLFWPRGTEMAMRERLVVARRRLTPPALSLVIVGILGMMAVGTWIFYNTSLRGEYLDRPRIFQKLADFEQTYRQYEDVVLPRITSVFAEVDIFPSERRVEIRGRYRLENQTTEPIRVLPITRSPRWVEGVLLVYGGVSFEKLDLPAHQVLVKDDALGFYVFELDQPIPPGDAIDLDFTVRVDHRAFVNSRHNNLVIENGTFFSNSNFFPFVGYARNNQLLDPAEREKRGLPPVKRVAELDDASGQARNYLESDWIDFEAIVSTRADQIAIAPGNLEKQWAEGDRRYFHYKTSAPITNLLPFLSGAYEVTRDRWQNIDIEVYFHPDHAFNIDRFIDTTKKSLAYMTANFGPYPHDQLRIVEIPNYHGKIAFAFAQTIPFSESWSFTADLDGVDLDWLTGILAHEVSHQWWNHQVVPADVQGSTLIGESLAQYSAMMILEEMYGPETVGHFLKFHLDRYLERRGNERVREMPLSLVENQAYIHYSKASLAFYSLKDLVGEAEVNRALRAFLESTKFQGPPFATSRDLLSHLRQVVPVEKGALIEDLFETITLFDNRVVEANFTNLDDGTYLVELKTSALKLRDDGHGTSIKIPLDDWVDIGVFGEQQVDGDTKETVLALEKRHLQSSEGTFTFVVDQRPVRAGIDPYHKLIDRDSGDNVRTVTELSRR